MSFFSQKVKYTLAFALALLMLAISGIWQVIDWRAYKCLMGQDLPNLSDDIVLIDIPYEHNLESFRRQQAQLLHLLAAHPTDLPREVILDIAFAEDNTGIDKVQKGIEEIKAMKIPVYATQLPDDRNEKFYSNYLTGWGHTGFDYFMGTFIYETILPADDPKFFPKSRASHGEELMALPIRVAVDRGMLQIPNKSTRKFVTVGSREAVQEHTVRFLPDASKGQLIFPPGVSLRAKTVIVGSLNFDKTPIYDLSGPALLAWAVSDIMMPTNNVKVWTSPWLMIAMILIFGLLSPYIFWLFFRLVPSWLDKLWSLFVLSIITGIALLVILVFVLRLTDIIYPCITLVVLSNGLAASFSYHYYSRNFNYDVFISYRRKDAIDIARVIQLAFKAKKIRAFLDTGDEQAGDWNEYLMKTIAETPNFVLILSRSCLDRCNERDDPFCKEITQAVKTDRRVVPVFLPEFKQPQNKNEFSKEINEALKNQGVVYDHCYVDERIDKLIKFLKK